MITNLGDLKIETTRMLQGLSASYGASFVTHERVLKKPVRQHVGNKLDEYHLRFKLKHTFCDPQTELLRLKAMADKADAVPLIFGYFDYNGHVTIDDLQVNFVDTADNGRPLCISGTMKLVQVVDIPKPKPPKPAVREPNAAKPVQTASVSNPTALIPVKQPLQHLADALQAEHRARALMRKVGLESNISYAAVAGAALQQVQQYYKNNPDAPLVVLVDAIKDLNTAASAADVDVIIKNFSQTQSFFASEATKVAMRWLG